MRIEVLGFGDCPDTPVFRERVQSAADELGGFMVISVDQESLPADDVRRGYPAPTALVDGHDLFGLPRPTTRGMACRIYAGGLPRVDDIASNLKALRQP